jgi:hypothetical protein
MMSLRKQIVSIAVTATAIAGTGVVMGTPAYAADSTGALRNAVTSLCLDWPGEMGPNGRLIYTSACNGSSTQQWTFTETDQAIRNTGTDFCLNSGGSTAVWIEPCGTVQDMENWAFAGDGRVNHLFWPDSCLEDEAGRQYVEVGLCDGRPNEVWQRIPA